MRRILVSRVKERDLTKKRDTLNKLVKKIIADGKMLVRIGETREIREYEYVDKQGKFYMFKGKSGYMEAFTLEQIYSNWESLKVKGRGVRND